MPRKYTKRKGGKKRNKKIKRLKKRTSKKRNKEKKSIKKGGMLDSRAQSLPTYPHPPSARWVLLQRQPLPSKILQQDAPAAAQRLGVAGPGPQPEPEPEPEPEQEEPEPEQEEPEPEPEPEQEQEEQEEQEEQQALPALGVTAEEIAQLQELGRLIRFEGKLVQPQQSWLKWLSQRSTAVEAEDEDAARHRAEQEEVDPELDYDDDDYEDEEDEVFYDIIPDIEKVLGRKPGENVLIHVTLNKELCEILPYECNPILIKPFYLITVFQFNGQQFKLIDILNNEGKTIYNFDFPFLYKKLIDFTVSKAPKELNLISADKAGWWSRTKDNYMLNITNLFSWSSDYNLFREFGVNRVRAALEAVKGVRSVKVDIEEVELQRLMADADAVPSSGLDGTAIVIGSPPDGYESLIKAVNDLGKSDFFSYLNSRLFSSSLTLGVPGHRGSTPPWAQTEDEYRIGYVYLSEPNIYMVEVEARGKTYTLILDFNDIMIKYNETNKLDDILKPIVTITNCDSELSSMYNKCIDIDNQSNFVKKGCECRTNNIFM